MYCVVDVILAVRGGVFDVIVQAWLVARSVYAPK